MICFFFLFVDVLFGSKKNLNFRTFFLSKVVVIDQVFESEEECRKGVGKVTLLSFARLLACLFARLQIIYIFPKEIFATEPIDGDL